MKKHNKIKWAGAVLSGVLCVMSLQQSAWAQSVGTGSLSSVTEESQIRPIPSCSGKYMLKSDGFYCLNEDGSLETTPAVYYFDHFVIGGTTFNGYYYHDESGRFKAEDSHLVHIRQIPITAEEGGSEADPAVFDGFYMVNNLGRISAAPQVRYLEQVNADGTVFDGFYFFDRNGRMVQEGVTRYLEGVKCQEREFSGWYYFGGTGGVLSQGGTTPEGLAVDENGKVTDMEAPGMDSLEKTLKKMISGFDGEWSVYVKDLGTEDELVINEKRMVSASLIKAFVMAKTYENMEDVRSTQAALLKTTPDNEAVTKKLDSLLTNMITVSDNESFNELVRLQTESFDFALGARTINRYLRREGYRDTSVMHTLAPSSSSPVGIGESNTTSVTDCGRLLEKIYRKQCVSRKASKQMLELLLAQNNTTKIPTALDDGICVANKTGENDSVQHDIAIVYGEKTDYILCVMSEGCKSEDDAIDHIRSISGIVYDYLNL